MTSLLARPDSATQWGSMPGWNIVADMTPPELVNLRWIAVLRRRIVLGLVLVVVLCAGGYFYASSKNGVASDDATAASSQTVGLTQSAAKYGGITRIEDAVDTIHGQIAGVMANDVNVAHVIASIRAALPHTMSIQNLSLELTPASISSGSTVGLDASGHPEIGKVTIVGSGRTLDDLPAFVDRLARVPGVVNVLPATNQVSSKVAQFSLTVSLTDRLYSHRFDVAHTGGK